MFLYFSPSHHPNAPQGTVLVPGSTRTGQLAGHGATGLAGTAEDFSQHQPHPAPLLRQVLCLGYNYKQQEDNSLPSQKPGLEASLPIQ